MSTPANLTAATDAIGGPNPIVGLRRKDLATRSAPCWPRPSATPAHRRQPRRRRARPGRLRLRRQGPPLRRPGVVAEHFLSQAAAALPGRRRRAGQLDRRHRTVRVDRERARFVLTLASDALAPSNLPVQPAAVKRSWTPAAIAWCPGCGSWSPISVPTAAYLGRWTPRASPWAATSRRPKVRSTRRGARGQASRSTSGEAGQSQASAAGAGAGKLRARMSGVTGGFRGRVTVRGVELHVDYRVGDGPLLVLFNGIGANLELLQPVVDAGRAAGAADSHSAAGRPRQRRITVGTPSVPDAQARSAGRRPDPPARLHRGRRAGHLLGRRLGPGTGPPRAAPAPPGGALCNQCGHGDGDRAATGAADSGQSDAVLPPVPDAGDRRPDLRRRVRRRPRVGGPLRRGHPARDPAGYYAQIAAGASWTSAHYLPWLYQQVLLIAGDDDPIVPLANARMMAAPLRRGSLHVLRGGGTSPCSPTPTN
jgi:hypothetical protein